MSKAQMSAWQIRANFDLNPGAEPLLERAMQQHGLTALVRDGVLKVVHGPAST